MKYRLIKLLLWIIILCSGNWLSANNKLDEPIIIDHNCTDLSQISEQEIIDAKNISHIAYGHTSHGSQLTTGMTGLVDFANNSGLGLSYSQDIFKWNNGGTDGALDLHDNAMGGDCGYYPQWVNNTRAYLDNSNNFDVNVIIWSWCGQASGKTEQGMIDTYLNPMAQLEIDYSNVDFVYMTGHRDIWADEILKRNNQQIRDYCIANNKILYDYADIESYDPDGTYYEFVNDNCDYYNSDFNKLGNWAIEWQNSHVEGVDWYNCSSAHSEPLNANRKAYAAWWLWARLAGWDGETPLDTSDSVVIDTFRLYQNYPNPFNPKTTIEYKLQISDNVELAIFNQLGKHVVTIVDEYQISGTHKIAFNAKELPSGMYIYRLKTGNKQFIKKMMLIK